MIKLKISLPFTDKLGWPLLTWERKVNGRIEEGKRAHWDFHRLYMLLLADLEFLPDFIFLVSLCQLDVFLKLLRHLPRSCGAVGPTRRSLMWLQGFFLEEGGRRKRQKALTSSPDREEMPPAGATHTGQHTEADCLNLETKLDHFENVSAVSTLTSEIIYFPKWLTSFRTQLSNEEFKLHLSREILKYGTRYFMMFYESYLPIFYGLYLI